MSSASHGVAQEPIGYLKWVEMTFRRKPRDHKDAIRLAQSKVARWMNENKGWIRKSGFPMQIMAGSKCRFMMIRDK